MSRTDPATVVRSAGGLCDAATLRAACSARRITRALADGEIVLLRRGRYGLPAVAGADRAAVALTGVVSHLSAALLWGWEVKTPPDRPHVTLRRGRRLTPEQRALARIHWTDGLRPDEVVDGRVRVTSPLRTLVDCLRTLPFDEALAVADSALRSGRVTRGRLLTAVETSPRTGRRAALAVAEAADGRAANPFESCLRAICLGVDGLAVTPQVRIGAFRVDLCDHLLGLVIEADSWTWHAGPDEFRSDVRRHTWLERIGLRVVRFSYDDVIRQPDEVAAVLRDVVALGPATAARRAHRSRGRLAV